MRKLYFLVGLLFFTSLSFAQVQRIPLHEGFTSSTCGPCAPGNANLDGIYASAPEKQIVLRYQMSWPGTGDPYYTSEGNNRRNVYGVNSVPALHVDGGAGINSNSYTAAMRDAAYNVPAYIELDVDYVVSCRTVDIDVQMIAHQDYSGANVLHAAIIEYETGANMKSNGETSFANVMKKMLPNANGTTIGAITNGDTSNFSLSYTFQGDYRLPNNATDPIIHANEHSVEEFFDLGVVVWVQRPNRQILQAAYAVSPTKVDLSLAELLTPVDISESTPSVEITAVLQNWQDSLVTSADVNYQLDNGPVITRSYSGLNLGLGDSIHVNFGDFTHSGPGTYNIKIWIDEFNGGTVVDDISCNDTIDATLTVHAAIAPVSSYTYSNVANLGLFTNTSTNNPIFPNTYQWDFGDGTTSSMENPNHSFPGPGIYNVCLTATNVNGSDTYCEDVAINVAGLSNVLEAKTLLYPNPSNGYITLENNNNEDMVFIIVDSKGNEVALGRIDANFGEELNLGDQAPGIYFFKGYAESGQVVKKITIE